MTFDGQHPCSMCKSIAESRKQQRETNEALPGLISLRMMLKEFVPPGTAGAPTPRGVVFRPAGFVPLSHGGSVHAERPPVPPPRESVV